MRGKKRFVATWNSLAGGFHDADTASEAMAFARTQGKFNSKESWWSVTDTLSGTTIAQGGAWT